jgi:hypothetical protein
MLLITLPSRIPCKLWKRIVTKCVLKNFREQLYLVFSRFCLQQSAGGSQFRVHSFRIYQRSVPIKNETPSLQGICSKRGGRYLSEMNAVQGGAFPAPSTGNYRSGDITGHHWWIRLKMLAPGTAQKFTTLLNIGVSTT